MTPLLGSASDGDDDDHGYDAYGDDDDIRWQMVKFSKNHREDSPGSWRKTNDLRILAVINSVPTSTTVLQPK